MPGPSGFVASLAGTGETGNASISLRWENLSGVRPDSYRVYQAEGAGEFFLAAEVDGWYQIRRIDNLKSSTNYQFYVVSVVDGIESESSEVEMLTTEACTLSLPNVSVVSSSSTQTTITITFSSPYETFAIYRSADDGRTWTYHEDVFNRAVFTDQALTPNKEYRYRYHAPTKSAPEEIRISTLPRPVGYPIEPVGLGVAIEHSAITLTWTNPGNHVVEVFRAKHDDDSEGPDSFSLIGTTAAGATSYTDTTFERNESYYCKIRTAIGANKSDFVWSTLNTEGIEEQRLFSTPSAPRLGVTIHVGPGTANPVPTEEILDSLGGDVTLAIHWQTTPLPWKLNLRRCGTRTHPIKITGIPNENGDLPLIDGRFAQEYGGISASQVAGLWIMGPRVGDPIGYKPNHIIFENLRFQHCRAEDQFYEFGTGTLKNYIGFCAAIRAKTALDFTVRNCEFDECPQGVSSGSGGFDRQFAGSPNVHDNTFRNWGGNYLGNLDGAHAIYLEGPRARVANNRGYTNAPGFGGMFWKVRGPDSLAEGNIQEKADGTPVPKIFDMIEAYTTVQNPHVRRMPDFDRITIRGNRLFLQAGGLYRASRVSWETDAYCGSYDIRFYNNTVVSEAAPGSSTAVRLFRTDGGGKALIAQWGNAFVSYGTGGADPRDLIVVEGDATVQHGKSFWSYDPIDADGTAMVVGRDKVTSGVPNPGFEDLGGGDYNPAENSVLRNAYVPGPVDAPAVTIEPGGETRPSVLDLGAYEYATASEPEPDPVVRPLWVFPARLSQTIAVPEPEPDPVRPFWVFRARLAYTPANLPPPPTPLKFPEAVMQSLLADSALDALLDGHAYPRHLPDQSVFPAVAMRIGTPTYGQDLDGPDGTADAVVEFIVSSQDYMLTTDITAAIRNLFGPMIRRRIFGVLILAANIRDGDDDYLSSGDAGDDGTFTDSVRILFQYEL